MYGILNEMEKRIEEDMTMAEQEYKTLIYQKDKEAPNIVYITINRPEKKNAISIGPQEVTGEIQDAMRRANDDDEIKVVIIKGQGEHFSAGFDLSQVYRVYGGGPGVRPSQSARLRIDDDHLMGMPGSILGCKKVTIAQIKGWCIEAGMYIIESCDIAIATKNAKFAHRGQRLAFGGMPFMPLELVMGHSKKITELLITGRTILAEEAELAGIITKAVEPEDLEEEVYNLAKAICLLPRDAIAVGKLCRRHAYDSLGATSLMSGIAYHTLGTNLTYGEDEKESVFIRDREKMGAKDAFHKLHIAFEEALNKTKYFKSHG
jgi:enoyl-CoA hydratase